MHMLVRIFVVRQIFKHKNYTDDNTNRQHCKKRLLDLSITEGAFSISISKDIPVLKVLLQLLKFRQAPNDYLNLSKLN